MSRASVISPYQKFYESDGVTPLSGGSAVFYENETTDLLAIYSDSELTIPRANPVTLDAGGGINGDVHFAVFATIVTYDAIGAEVETFDDVSCFDESIPLALWDPTVVYGDDRSSSNIVQSPVDDNYYISIQALNLNHEPSASPSWWLPFGAFLLIGGALVPAGYVAIGNATTGLAGVSINAKGSILAGNGTLPVALPVGTDGYALVASSGAASGLAYAAVAGPSVVRVPRTSNTILGTSNLSQLIDVTSGTFSQTFDTVGNGWFVYYRNSGTGDITLSITMDGVLNPIMYPNECRMIQFNSSGSTYSSVVLTPFSRTVTTTEAIMIPPGYAAIAADVISGGGGGGRANAGSATGAGGGGGGARSGPIPIYGLTAGSSVTATIGAGGAGASSNNSNGTAGGNSSFGAHVVVTGGAFGVPGGSGGPGGDGGAIGTAHTSNTAAGGVGGTGGAAAAGVGRPAEYGGGGGAGGSGPAIGGAGGSSVFAASGGGGGSGATYTGGAAGSVGAYVNGGGAAGGGPTGGATGNVGTAGTASANGLGGGGGGGGSGGSTTGGAGGAGGIPGGGGGGGADGGTTSGNGGSGARGEIRVSGVI